MTKCVCEGNWRLIVSEYEDRIGSCYSDHTGQVWHFFGLVHGGDDYYYGMSKPGGGLMLLSCVGSIEGHGYKPLPKFTIDESQRVAAGETAQQPIGDKTQ